MVMPDGGRLVTRNGPGGGGGDAGIWAAVKLLAVTARQTAIALHPAALGLFAPLPNAQFASRDPRRTARGYGFE